MKAVFAMFSLMLSLSVCALAAERGNEGAHGGDDIGLEFQAALGSALAEIKASDPELQAKIMGLQLDSLYEREGARALVVDEAQHVTIEGAKQECVATSDSSSMQTLITRARWQGIRSMRLKQGIALHEALVLKNIESTGQYPISGKFLARFGLQAASLISGNPELSLGKGKVLTVECKPVKYWRANAAENVTQLYLVFDGKRGLQDPALVLSYRTDSGLPARTDVFAADLDSDTPGNIEYRVVGRYGSMLPAVWLSKVSFDFKALTLGATGKGIATEQGEERRGIDSRPARHELRCKITNTPPKG